MRILGLILMVAVSCGMVPTQEVAASTDWSRILLQAGAQSTSVRFVRLSDGQPLVSFNENLALTPASSMKVVTVAAILETFSPAFNFKTRFFHTGTRKGDTITGDLIVVGDGDPFIVSEMLWQLAADFSHMGIRKIEGNIIIDNSLFSESGRDDSRMEGALSSTHAYDAPVSAFGVNFNTIAIAVAPNPNGGGTALSALDPYPLNGFSIVNQINTSPNGRTNLNAMRLSKKDGTELRVSGSITKDQAVAKVYRSIDSHVNASGEYLRSFLAGRGIRVTGGIKEGVVPTHATLLYTLESYPMSKIVAGLNKFSNNFIADVLMLRLGAERPLSGAPRRAGSGTYQNGLAVINRFLAEQVKTIGGYKIVNGSGLSTGNRLSARHLTDVLMYASKKMELFPEFLASFPASGWDGTLKNRFDEPGTSMLSGKVRAKTGTLTQPVSVSSLAGYVRHPKHGFVAFAIIQNGIPGKPQPAIDGLRRSQDALLLSFMNSE